MLFGKIICADAAFLTAHGQLSSCQHLADAHKLHWEVSTPASCIHPKGHHNMVLHAIAVTTVTNIPASPTASLKQATFCMRTTNSVVPMLSIQAMVKYNNIAPYARRATSERQQDGSHRDLQLYES